MYGQVAQYLPVLCQVKVFQTVFVLFWSVLHLKRLKKKQTSVYILRILIQLVN